MKWLFPHPMLSLSLLVIWLLLVNSFSPAQMLLGAFLGWAIPRLTNDFLVDVPRIRKPFKLALFGLRVLCDIVVANLQVARLVLGPKDRLVPAFVEMPLDARDEFVLAFLSSVISLTPGTVSASLSPDRRTLLLHALDASDPEGLVAEIKQRYEAPLLEIFECSST